MIEDAPKNKHFENVLNSTTAVLWNRKNRIYAWEQRRFPRIPKMVSVCLFIMEQTDEKMPGSFLTAAALSLNASPVKPIHWSTKKYKLPECFNRLPYRTRGDSYFQEISENVQFLYQ